jgi:hypothetical protein
MPARNPSRELVAPIKTALSNHRPFIDLDFIETRSLIGDMTTALAFPEDDGSVASLPPVTLASVYGGAWTAEVAIS